LTRAIRHAEARDRVGRNVATLVDTPKGQTGRPSKSLTFEQASALVAVTEDTRMHAYISLCLATGSVPRKPGNSAGTMLVSAIPPPTHLYRRVRRCGGLSGPTETPRPRSPAVRWDSPRWRSTPSKPTKSGSKRSDEP
jgi:hypothetical protein